jgi:myo-inositol-1(or 4)-monophosphatase
MQPTLYEIQSMAIQAGKILRDGYGQKHNIQHKGPVDLVTEIDRRSEDFIVSRIQASYPDHTIITEESAPMAGNRQYWYIDPLDGTVNYAHGLPTFSVSIAYVENDQAKMGVVYDPLRDECFCAERGIGAFLNGEPLHVAHATRLVDSLLVTGFPYDIATTQANNLDYYGRFARLTQGVRRSGSAALDLCYVAAGRFDGYWELSLKTWDLAAGGLIAEEAGAKVTTAFGLPGYLTPPNSILAANPTLHQVMLATLLEKE